jgi:hypothetical protein
MITKSELCRKIIEDFTSEIGRYPKESDIISSSRLAVAMEYLGLLETDEFKEYAQDRGGVLFTFWNGEEVRSLSYRELLHLLPDKM